MSQYPPLTVFGLDLPLAAKGALIGGPWDDQTADIYSPTLAAAVTLRVGDNNLVGNASTPVVSIAMPTLPTGVSRATCRLFYTQPVGGNTIVLFGSNVRHVNAGYFTDTTASATTVYEFTTTNGGTTWWVGATSDVPGFDPLKLPGAKFIMEANSQVQVNGAVAANVFNRTGASNAANKTAAPTLASKAVNFRTPGEYGAARVLDYNAANRGSTITGLTAINNAQPWVSTWCFSTPAPANDSPLFQFTDGTFFGPAMTTTIPYVFSGGFNNFTSMNAAQNGGIHTLSLIWTGAAAITRLDGARILPDSTNWSLPSGATGFWINTNTGDTQVGKFQIYAGYMLYGASTLVDDTHQGSPVQLMEAWALAQSTRFF